MFKRYRVFFTLFVVLLIIIIGSGYFTFLKSMKNDLVEKEQKEYASFVQEKVNELILIKQKATVAIALSVAHDEHLAQHIVDRDINANKYYDFVTQLRNYTLYKNIWIHVLDKNGISLFRSWNKQKGDSVCSVRDDIAIVLKEKKITYSLSVGKFDLSIKAIVPLFLDNEFVGIVEVISHFNSIANVLKKSHIDSVVVINKEYKDQLIAPFTNLFIGDYYIANYNAPQSRRDYLAAQGIENYLHEGYKVEGESIIVSTPLKNINSKIIGYYVSFSDTKDMQNTDIKFFMFRWIALSIIVIFGLTSIVVMFLFFANKKQKKYYKNILDTSTNIMVINDTKRIISVNHIFFDYFKSYKTLEAFKSKHPCICDFFVTEEGYLQKENNGVNWVDYLIKNTDMTHKVKMKIEANIYYFIASASFVSQELNHYSIVLSDITNEEDYRIKLEHLTITDPLTSIGKRRHYNKSLENEIYFATRYGTPFSLIMFDLDNFKMINDTYGHDTGDEILIRSTELIASYLRQADIFSRIGGEEFTVILPRTNREDAVKIAEKLRIEIESFQYKIAVTMSFGVVEYKMDESADDIYRRVDNALYTAKESGRNRVIVG